MTWIGAAMTAALALGDLGSITFNAGPKPTAAAPVVFDWPKEWGTDGVAFEDASGLTHFVQKHDRGGRAVGVCIAPSLAAGQQASCKIVAARVAETGTGVALTKYDEGVSVKIDGEPFTNFITKRQKKPILWPLLGPKGERLTQNGPKDHIHHRSFWFTHGHVNGHDFWSESPRAGKTVVGNLHPLTSGPVFGEISCNVDWIAKDGGKVCTDERTIRFYRIPGVRIIDFEIVFRPTDADLVFGDDKEGTFGVRVAETMSADQPKGKPPGGTLVNAEGLKNAEVWGKKSSWCDYYGPVDGGVAGVAIFDHPMNLRHPTTWHARTYGLFCANPFGLSFFTNKKENGEHRVSKGSEFRLKYRVLLHSGDCETANVASQFDAYANPPTVGVR
jgi:hypothetical protein